MHNKIGNKTVFKNNNTTLYDYSRMKIKLINHLL